MKLEKFILMALSKGTKFIDGIHGIRRTSYAKLAKLTELVNFHCEFDDAGRCRNYKGVPDGEPAMCCCNSCFNSMGYLYTLPTGGWQRKTADRLRALKVYARHFSEKIIVVNGHKRKIGFWRPEKGCVLPRIHRSPTCLTYTCGYKQATEWEHMLSRLINGHIKYPVKVRGHKYDEYSVAEAMEKWHKELEVDDQHKNK